MSERRNVLQRLRRSDSFLGIHFDFHADESSVEVGKHTTVTQIEAMLQEVQPDYVQIDCKGHRGLSSYPTAVGYQAPGIIGDPLHIWREATARNGVSLYMHYSGVWDTEAITHHPTWARIDEQGEKDPNNTSVFGPYVDQLLIPQLKELKEVYNVDGVWIDGECWATAHDYTDQAVERFLQESGLTVVPRTPEEEGYSAFSDFCREAFRHYLRHYVDEVHRVHPDFEIASNWAFSSQMPEPCSVNVDFLSGDYTLQDSVNSARLQGRCMMGRGRPWDLMAWAFSCRFAEGDWCVTSKTAIQLKQEAAVVLALGGGFQAYFQQKRKDGSISPWQMRVMKEVADFCRARQAWCHHSEPIPQIAVLYSGSSVYANNPRLFNPGGLLDPMHGVLNALLDNQYSVELLIEFQLQGCMTQYPVIVVPEWSVLEESFQQELLNYVKQGGQLVLMGPDSVRIFADALELKESGERSDEPVRQWLAHEGVLAGHYARRLQLDPQTQAKTYGSLYEENDFVGEAQPASLIVPYGAGQIAACLIDMGERYRHATTTVARDYVGGLIEQLYPNPKVKVRGSRQVDVQLSHKDGYLLVHLVNTAGSHADVNCYSIDQIPSVGPLEIRIQMDQEPQKMTIQPGNKALAWSYVDGYAVTVIEQLEIYDILVVEQSSK